MKKCLFYKCKVTDTTGEGLIFEKELIYVGEFGTEKKGYFTVDEPLIDHWVVESATMGAQGFKINLPIDHTLNPELNRGEVRRLYKKKNSKGKPALFGTIAFASEEYAKLALTTDVSIFCPPMYEMGNGYIALRPITHVALTDYPLVPGLEGFETIAASLKEESMNILELAVALGLTPAEGADDKAIAEMIVEKFKELTKTPEPSPDPNTDAVAASMLSILKKNREVEIDLAVMNRKLTPAEAKDYKSEFKVTTIAASLTDGFDRTMALVNKRPALAPVGSEKTPTQKYDTSTSPLVRDAQRRAGKKGA